MRAVILAGGVGSRLEQMTNGRPKCLVEIGGRPLILHQLEALSDHGVGPVLMVVGYKHEAIREVVGRRVDYLVNERFGETNSLYSLWLAREWIEGPFLLLNSDLLFDPAILSRLLEEPGNVLAYDSTSSRGHEQTKVAIRGRRVVDLGKDLPPVSARGESIGLIKFDADGAKAALAVADELVRDGQDRAWVIEATRGAAKTVPFYGVNIAGLGWAEVDFPYDLEHARREVWPAIWRGRWRRVVYWRRTRRGAGLLAAMVLALSGWLLGARVGPASVDWENVAPESGSPLALQLPRGSQTWWQAGRDGAVAARVPGGMPIRLEFRLLMPAGRAEPGQYVVAVTVDGEAHGWKAFSATPDLDAELAGALVGDRDRLELPLPPGQHVVQVSLVAGHGDRMLVRIRRPE